MNIPKQMLQDSFLSTLQQDQTPVSMFLVNGIKFLGTIQSFDHYVVVLKGVTTQMVFKHAISTIVPLSKAAINREGVGESSDGNKEVVSPSTKLSTTRPQVVVKRRKELTRTS